ncbi:unnamed protein product, partial [Amoebophrya sp. A25]|eukprot:GSA25T00023210001.1
MVSRCCLRFSCFACALCEPFTLPSLRQVAPYRLASLSASGFLERCGHASSQGFDLSEQEQRHASSAVRLSCAWAMQSV